MEDSTEGLGGTGKSGALVRSQCRQTRLWLDPIPDNLRALAFADLERGDPLGFLGRAANTSSLDLVYFNSRALRDMGIYERALLGGYIATRTNNQFWPVRMLKAMFDQADRARLRAAGSPLPSSAPYTLYRGVAGRGPARRVRSLSWTSSFERAAWFARRFPCFADPAVYRVVVSEDAVLAYVNERNEDEFIVSLPASARPIRDSRLTQQCQHGEGTGAREREMVEESR